MKVTEAQRYKAMTLYPAIVMCVLLLDIRTTRTGRYLISSNPASILQVRKLDYYLLFFSPSTHYTDGFFLLF